MKATSALLAVPRILVALLLLAGQLPLAELQHLPADTDTTSCSCSCGSDCACGQGCCGTTNDERHHAGTQQTARTQLQSAAAWRAHRSCGCCSDAVLLTPVRRDLIAVVCQSAMHTVAHPAVLLPALSGIAHCGAGDPCCPGPRGPPNLQSHAC